MVLVPIKSTIKRPSEHRPVGRPKYVMPYGYLPIDGKERDPIASKFPVSVRESPKLNREE